jgi:hypothetical protein
MGGQAVPPGIGAGRVGIDPSFEDSGCLDQQEHVQVSRFDGELVGHERDIHTQVDGANSLSVCQSPSGACLE